MKIMVTGSGTVIGNKIAERLLIDNHHVICAYNKIIPKNLKKFKNSSLLKINLEKIFKTKFEANVLVHCASATPEKYTSKYFNKINVVGFNNLLKNFNQGALKKVILISTIAVYEDNKEKTINENIKPKHHTRYAISKFRQEKILDKFKRKDLQKIILRLGSILSKNCKVNFYCKTVLNIKRGKKVYLLGKKKYINSIFYVDDLANLVCKLVQNSYRKSKLLYNIVSSKPIKLTEVVNLMYKKLKKPKKIILLEKMDKEYIFSIKKLSKTKFQIPTTLMTLKKFLRYV